MSIYAVWGPPHSGKTTLAIDMAFSLSQKGQSVLLLSTELFSELSASLNVQIKKEKSLAAIAEGNVSVKQVVQQVDSLLFALAVPYDNDAFDGDISSNTAKELLEQAVTLFDDVIVDCQSSACSIIAAWALQQADMVVMLTGACSSAALWDLSFKRAIHTERDKLLYICDQIASDFDYRALCGCIHATPSVWLPYYPDARMTQETRRSLYGSNSKIGKEYSQKIDEICVLLKEGVQE